MVLHVIFNPCYNFAGSKCSGQDHTKILLSSPNQHQRIRRKVHAISMTSYAFLPYCNCMYCLHVVYNYVNNTFLIYSFFWLPLFDSLALIGHMNEDGLAILCRICGFHIAITCASWLMSKTIKYLTVSVSVIRDKYTCVMFLTFSFWYQRKNNK